MDRRTFLERLTAVTAIAGVAGCANPLGNDGTGTTADTRTPTATGTRTGTESGEPPTAQPTTTDDGPPDIPRPGTPPAPTETTESTTTNTGHPDISPPGTPPMSTTTATRTTTDGGPPEIPPPGTPPSAATTNGTTDDGPPDIPAPGTPPAPTKTPAFSPSCSLSHTIVSSGDDLTPSSVSVMQYPDLSSAAKRVVRRAVATNGTVSIPYDSPQRPPEFAYSDESHVYDIEYRGTTYRLITGTGMGCPVITATE